MWIEVMILIWLLLLSIWDARGCFVPTGVLCGGSGAVLVAALVQCSGTADYMAVGIGMLPGALLLVLGLCTRMIGYGDGIAVLALGAYVGIREGVLLLVISMFVLAICSLVLLLMKKVKGNTRIPYLPFLTIGWLVLRVF